MSEGIIPAISPSGIKFTAPGSRSCHPRIFHLFFVPFIVMFSSPVLAAGTNGNVNPADCPNRGDQCSDGSYYAGPSPDGNEKMYVTDSSYEAYLPWARMGAADLLSDFQGTFYMTRSMLGDFYHDMYGERTIFDASFENDYFIDTEIENCRAGRDGVSSSGLESSCRTGQENTAFLAGLKPRSKFLNKLLKIEKNKELLKKDISPYPAAKYCHDLNAHGHDDWYLPAQNELDLLLNGRSPIANVQAERRTDGKGMYYWSSSELNGYWAWTEAFPGTKNHHPKDDSNFVRCVRK